MSTGKCSAIICHFHLRRSHPFFWILGRWLSRLMKYPGGLALNDLCSWLSMQPATFQSSRVLLLFQEWHRFKMWQAQCAQLLLVNFGCDEQWLSSAYLWPQRCVRKQCHSVPLCHSWYLLVGGLEHEFYFPIYWVANHPNWLIFFRGVAQPPTSIQSPWCRLVPHHGSHVTN